MYRLHDPKMCSQTKFGIPRIYARDTIFLDLMAVVMLRLHYVPGDHGSHDFGHRGRNGVTVTQRRGTGSTNVTRRGCRDRRDRFLNSQKICHGSHGGIDLLKCAVVERGERNKT